MMVCLDRDTPPHLAVSGIAGKGGNEDKLLILVRLLYYLYLLLPDLVKVCPMWP